MTSVKSTEKFPFEGVEFYTVVPLTLVLYLEIILAFIHNLLIFPATDGSVEYHKGAGKSTKNVDRLGSPADPSAGLPCLLFWMRGALPYAKSWHCHGK